MGDLAPLIPIVAILLIFWLLVLMPASRRQRQMREMQAALGVGDEVILTSGIFGTVAEVADAHLLVEVSPGTTIKVARSAIGAVGADTVLGQSAADERDDAETADPTDPEER